MFTLKISKCVSIITRIALFRTFFFFFSVKPYVWRVDGIARLPNSLLRAVIVQWYRLCTEQPQEVPYIL